MRLIHRRVLLSASVLALALPGLATAKPAVSHSNSGSEACPIRHVILNVTYSCAAEFSLRASNGYRIKVSADPGGRHGEVQLSAEGHGGVAQYRVPGSVTASAIKASFGRLGRVSLRFQPSGHERRVRIPKSCIKERPPSVSSRLGTFVGTLKFRGERGYTHVVAHRVAGAIGDPLSNTSGEPACEFHESAAQRKRELRSVTLSSSPPNAGASFDAVRVFSFWPKVSLPGQQSVSRGSRYLFLASEIEFDGPMWVFRYAGAIGGPDDFPFNDTLTTATATPPAPFVGTGDFLRKPDGSTSWTGLLTVPLPGLGSVPLTGPGFKAELSTVARVLRHTDVEARAP